MRKLAVGIVFLMVASGASAQLGVAIMEDSPATVMDRISAIQDRVTQLQHLLDTVQNTRRMVQFQLRAAESLGEGSWDGFVAAAQQHATAMGAYSNAVAGLDELHALEALTSTEGFSDYAEETQALAELSATSSNVLTTANNAFERTQRRLETMDALTLQAEGEDRDGILQIQGQQLALVGQTLNEVQTSLNAANNHYATQARIEQEREERNEENRRRAAKGMDHSRFESTISEEEYENRVFGRRLQNR